MHLNILQRYTDGASSQFPGAPKASYTGVMAEASIPSHTKPVPVFRMMDENGDLLPGVKEPAVSPS